MKERNFIKLKNYMFIGSGIVMILGVIAFVLNGGFTYGIDFKGGSQLQVSIGEQAAVSTIKSIVGKKASVIRISSQIETEAGKDKSDQFLIKASFESDSAALQAKELSKSIIKNIQDKYPLKLVGELRQDVNSVSFELEHTVDKRVSMKELSLYLGDNTQLEQVDGGKSYIITKSISKLIAQKSIIEPLTKQFKNLSIENSTTYDPTQGEVIKGQALKVSLLVLVLILLYIGLRFKFRFGVAAIIALLHDTLILICFILFFNREVDISIIVAILTIMGYSLNDTIVVFDRIRENQKLLSTSDYTLVVNKSITQSLSRTLVTSLTTLFVVLCIYIFGGTALENLSFALLVGVFVGTYSSIFVASPVLVMWDSISSTRLLKTGNVKKTKKNKIVV